MLGIHVFDKFVYTFGCQHLRKYLHYACVAAQYEV